MPHCTHCDTFVSQNFARVFGDDDGLIHACPNCAANAGIAGTAVERRSGV